MSAAGSGVSLAFALSLAPLAACSDAASSEAGVVAQAGAAASAADGGGPTANANGASGHAAAGTGAAGVDRSTAGRAGAAAVGSGQGSAGEGAASAAPAAVSGAGGSDRGPGAAGASGAPAAGPSAVQPIERSGRYALELEGVVFEVDPNQGARVTRYEIAGQNLVTGPEVDATNWGSTFWPSPQQRWDWPPVPELDSQAYTGGIDGAAIVLTSAVGERAKVQVEKRFSADATARAIEIAYTLTNRDTAAASWAGWEITRVAPGGLTFFPTGTTTVNTQLAVANLDALSWYAHEPSSLGMSGGQKFSADGSGGWLAHVAGRTLLVKQFVDVPPAMQAPAPEAEIEIYAAATYVEIEPQGPYTPLQPGESLHWTVRWLAQQLDSSVEVTSGNPVLVELAESLLQP